MKALKQNAGSAIKYFRMEATEAAETQGLLKGLILIVAGVFCTFRSYWFIVTFPVLSVILKNLFTSSAVLWMFTGISLIVEALFDVVSLIINTRKGKVDAGQTAKQPDSAKTEGNKTV